MSLSTWLLCDALEKGGPGSGPHVLSAGALSSLQRLAQDDTHEGRLAAEKLKEYQQRHSMNDTASAPLQSSQPHSRGASSELNDARTASAAAKQASVNAKENPSKENHQSAADQHREARDKYQSVSSKESQGAASMVKFHNDKAMFHDREARKF